MTNDVLAIQKSIKFVVKTSQLKVCLASVWISGVLRPSSEFSMAHKVNFHVRKNEVSSQNKAKLRQCVMGKRTFSKFKFSWKTGEKTFFCLVCDLQTIHDIP